MRAIGQALLLSAAMVLTHAACAQAPAQPDNDEIVVTGREQAPTRGEVAEQARILSGASAKYDENLARFQVPVCPTVTGLESRTAKALVRRIRANIALVGAPLAKEKCSPNFVVALVEDARSFLSGLEQKHPDIFAQIRPVDRTEILDEAPLPVRVWSNVVTLNLDGMAIMRSPDGKEQLPSVWGYTNRWFVKFHRDIRSVLVLFDREDVYGMTGQQLADYATMRGLANMRPATGDEPMSTILALFSDGGRDMAGLTNFDIGYLRSLYWENASESAVSKLLRVQRQMEKAQRQAIAP